MPIWGPWSVESGRERNSQSFPRNTRASHWPLIWPWRTESHLERFVLRPQDRPFPSKEKEACCQGPSPGSSVPAAQGGGHAATGFILFLVLILPNCLERCIRWIHTARWAQGKTRMFRMLVKITGIVNSSEQLFTFYRLCQRPFNRLNWKKIFNKSNTMDRRLGLLITCLYRAAKTPPQLNVLWAPIYSSTSSCTLTWEMVYNEAL